MAWYTGRMRRLRGLLVVALASAGCPGPNDALSDSASASGPDTEDDGQASATGHDCLTNDAFFRERVWGEVLRPLCFECHRAGGEAEQTNLVFVDQDADPNQQRTNEEVFTVVSFISFDGEPWTLVKPTGGVAHGGGVNFEVDSREYRILEEMIARVRDPVECP
jgi:hypothetical protein